MALFAGGRSANGRGGLHIRGTGRGRGRGRGRGSNSAGHFPKQSTFNSTRVEEPTESQSNDDKSSSEVGEGDIDEVSDGSSQEEDPIEPNIKPYNVLLQSLKANVLRAQPARKKRRIEDKHSFDRSTPIDLLENPNIDSKPEGDIDHVDELEDENTVPGEYADLADSDENEDRKPHNNLVGMY